MPLKMRKPSFQRLTRDAFPLFEMLKIPGVPIPRGEGKLGGVISKATAWKPSGSGRGKRFFHQFNFKFWIISRNGVKTEGTCR